MDKTQLFEKAAQAGFEVSELYSVARTETSVEVCEGEVESHEISSSRAICFRGIIEGKMGYASTEKIDDEAIDMLIETAKECALLVEKDDKEFIYDGQGEYAKIDNYDEAIADLDTKTHVDMALALEAKTKALAPELEKVAESVIAVYTTQAQIVNSNGLNLENRRTQVVAYTEPVAKDGDGVVNGGEIMRHTTLEALDLDQVAEVAVKKTLRKVGAKSVPSGKYKVIFENEMMGTLLATMQSAFFADVMQEGKSLLKGKVGEVIAAPCINVLDDPHMMGGLGSCGFDDEGVPTYKKHIVENGVFKGFLHNLKTAHKEGVKTTGNGSKAGITSPVRVASSNLYVQEGEIGLEALLNQVQDGIFITNLDGVHSGANAITGDFSLAARGMRIEGGKLTHGIKQITIAGNFFEMIKNIETVASDFKMKGAVGSPSVFVKEISVAGE